MNREAVERILNKYTAQYGFCKFSRVRQYLIPCRNSDRIPQDAKTVIVVLFPYYLGEEAYRQANVSRYAAVPDYHAVAGNYLGQIAGELKDAFPKEDFVYFTDNSPIPEVQTASAAGLGCIGKNGLLINEEYGSWVFIGELVSTLELEFVQQEINYCSQCGKCAEICPTGVLSDEVFDKEKCLSHITQKKGEIPEIYQALMRKYDCAWGCDLCQKACPMNSGVKRTPIEEFISGFSANVKPDEEIEGRAFAWRGKKVIGRNLKIINQESDK